MRSWLLADATEEREPNGTRRGNALMEHSISLYVDTLHSVGLFRSLSFSCSATHTH